MRNAITLVAIMVCVVFNLQKLDAQGACQERADRSNNQNIRQDADPKGQIVVFTADWCAPCSVQKIYTKALETRYKVVKYNVDDPKGKKLYKEYGGKALPFTAIVVDGEVKKRFQGVTTVLKIEEYAAEARKDGQKNRRWSNIWPFYSP